MGLPPEAKLDAENAANVFTSSQPLRKNTLESGEDSPRSPNPPRQPYLDDVKKHRSDASLFAEINRLRKPETRQSISEKDLNLNGTIFAKIATNKQFEFATMIVIVINAAFIGLDADFTARGKKGDDLYNTEETPIIFPIAECVFAFYFSVEVVIRFFAFAIKRRCICDMWFVFDSILVAFMVVETWILPIFKASGPLSQLSVLRLLRLLRMVKFMRFVPELQVIVKGLLASVRAVASTAILQILLLYVFAIFFTSFYHQGKLQDDDDDILPSAQLFGSMMKSMRTLFIMGTILDDVTEGTNTIRSSKNSNVMLPVFILFILVSSFTILNLLVGVLCEVVSATSEGEHTKNMENNVQNAIAELFEKMDMDGDGLISRKEFMAHYRDKNVIQALRYLNINEQHFKMYGQLLFPLSGEEPDAESNTVNYENLLDLVMRLRPGMGITKLDFATLSNDIKKGYGEFSSRASEVEKQCVVLHHYVGGGDFERAMDATSTPELCMPKLMLSALPQLERMPDAVIMEELKRRNVQGYVAVDPRSPQPGAAKAAAPRCKGCDKVMQWSDYAGGLYSSGWHCENLATCGSNKSTNGPFRWFCPDCGDDYCNICYPKAASPTVTSREMWATPSPKAPSTKTQSLREFPAIAAPTTAQAAPTNLPRSTPAPPTKTALQADTGMASDSPTKAAEPVKKKKKKRRSEAEATSAILAETTTAPQANAEMASALPTLAADPIVEAAPTNLPRSAPPTRAAPQASGVADNAVDTRTEAPFASNGAPKLGDSGGGKSLSKVGSSWSGTSTSTLEASRDGKGSSVSSCDDVVITEVTETPLASKMSRFF